MNENSAIFAINAAAGRFCDLYKGLGTSLDKIGGDISNLQTLVDEKSQKYNVSGKVKDFFNDDNITIESYYESLSDSEKFKDEKGNIVSVDMLTDSERQSLESQVKQLNAEQGDAKLEIVTMKAQIDKLSMQFEREINKVKNQLKVAKANFDNEKDYLKTQKRMLDTQIDNIEYEIKRMGYQAQTNGNGQYVTNAISEYRKQIATINVQKLVINCSEKVADLYNTVFNDIFKFVEPNMHENVNFVDLDNLYNDELSIADKIKNLMDSFKVFKDNYSAELDKIDAIELAISEFKQHYEGVANANEFITKATETTKKLRNTIKSIEDSKEIDKAHVDKYGRVEGQDINNGPQNNNPENNEEQNNGPENNTPENNTPENNTPENNTQQNNTGENTPQNNTPENNGQQNNNPGENGLENNTQENNELQGNNLGNGGLQPTSGVSNDVANVMKAAKRVRSARRMTTMKVSLTTGCVALAAAGLAFVPPLAPISAALFSGATVLGAGSIAFAAGRELLYDLPAIARYNSTSFKLNRIAHNVTKQFNKNNKKSGIKFKIRTVPETGEVRFAIVKNGVDVGLIDSRSTGMAIGDDYSLNQAELQSVVDMFQEQLDKKFKNFNGEKRGDYQEKYNLPRITVDNLPVLYTQFGGYNFNIESEQFGMMDTVKLKKAKKNGKGIKNLFSKFRRNKEENVEEDNLPPINPTQDDALNELTQKNGNFGDGTSSGAPVSDDEIDDLSGDLNLDNKPDDGLKIDDVQQNDELNDAILAGYYNKYQQQFGLDDIEMLALESDLSGLTDDQIANLDSLVANTTDKNVLFNSIDQIKNPVVDNGLGL